MRWYEKAGFAFLALYLVAGASVSVGHAAAKPRPLGPFTLVLVFSHHAYNTSTAYPLFPGGEKDRDWIDVVDQVATVGTFSGWDTCDGAALEAQARLADPGHDRYVQASCLFLGPLGRLKGLQGPSQGSNLKSP